MFPKGVRTVVIASGAVPTDGLTAASVAAARDGSMLYVHKDSVPASVATEIKRLVPTDIVIIGSTAGVSAKVATALGKFGAKVRRLSGVGSAGTARAALADWPTKTKVVYLASNGNLIDPSLAVATSGRANAGILLVNGRASKADAETIAALKKAGATSVIGVGGTSWMASAYLNSLKSAGFAISRRAGADRNLQAIALASGSLTASPRAIVADSTKPTDLIVATTIAAVTRQPLYFAVTRCMPDSTAKHLSSTSRKVTAVGGTMTLQAPVLSNTSCTKLRTQRQTALIASINAVKKKYKGTFSVSVRELGGLSQVVSVSGATRREPASMLKLFATYVVLKKVDQGKYSLSKRLASGVTLRDCIKVMIHASDNYCHDDVVKLIGRTEMNRVIAAAGFTSTTYGSGSGSVLYAGNRSTTNNLTVFAQKLAQRKLLSKSRTDYLLSLMRSQIWRSRIASGIPKGVGQASKPGALWVSSGLLQADTGIISAKQPYVISIIGVDGPSKAALAAISRAVYTHFNGSFGTAAKYPVQQMITTKAVTMRSSAGGTKVGTVPKGRYIEVIDAKRLIYMVRYAGRVVWVDSRSLRNR